MRRVQTPPLMCHNTRFPPTHRRGVGMCHRQERLPQKSCSLDSVVTTEKDRCMGNAYVDVSPGTGAYVTAVYNTYFEPRSRKTCAAGLKYSNLRLPKADLRCQIAYQTELPEERRFKHRNNSKLTIITEFNNNLFGSSSS